MIQNKEPKKVGNMRFLTFPISSFILKILTFHFDFQKFILSLKQFPFYFVKLFWFLDFFLNLCLKRNFVFMYLFFVSFFFNRCDFICICVKSFQWCDLNFRATVNVAPISLLKDDKALFFTVSSKNLKFISVKSPAAI